MRIIKKIIKDWNQGVDVNVFNKLDASEEKLASLEDGSGSMKDIAITKMEVEELSLKRDSLLKEKKIELGGSKREIEMVKNLSPINS